MRNFRTKNIILVFLFIIIAAPLLQHTFHFIESGKLNGGVTNAQDTFFTIDGWLDGSFQKHEDDYLNDNMGFRNDFVRINNQLDYSLFNVVHANGVVIGKQGYLYEKGYIDAYCGINFPGDDVVRQKLLKLKRIQDTLAKMGKYLIVMQPASKVSYYPEYVPDELQCPPTGYNYYHAYVRLMDSLGIRQIDCNGWFRNLKNKTQFRLFTEQGTHWTLYGAALAADSLNRYMQSLSKTRLATFTWHKVEQTTTPRNSDDDLIRGLNLILPYKTRDTFSYPIFEYDIDGKYKPKVIYIADSYFWVIEAQGIPQFTNNNWELWYYFNEVWNNDAIGGRGEVTHINSSNKHWIDSMFKADFTVIMYSETNLKNFAGGFVEQAYSKLFEPQK